MIGRHNLKIHGNEITHNFNEFFLQIKIPAIGNLIHMHGTSDAICLKENDVHI